MKLIINSKDKSGRIIVTEINPVNTAIPIFELGVLKYIEIDQPQGKKKYKVSVPETIVSYTVTL